MPLPSPTQRLSALRPQRSTTILHHVVVRRIERAALPEHRGRHASAPSGPFYNLAFFAGSPIICGHHNALLTELNYLAGAGPGQAGVWSAGFDLPNRYGRRRVGARKVKAPAVRDATGRMIGKRL